MIQSWSLSDQILWMIGAQEMVNHAILVRTLTPPSLIWEYVYTFNGKPPILSITKPGTLHHFK